MEKSKNVIKRVGKSFRLIDFHIFNRKGEIHSDDDSSIDSSEKVSKWNDDPENFIIQMFGINEKGETCCIYLNSYKPFFFIKVGDDWDEEMIMELRRDIQNKIGKYHSKSIVSMELVDHHKLYGFSGGKKHRFAKITFQNTMAMNKVRNLWYYYVDDKNNPKGGNIRKLKGYRFPEKGTNLELYESTIPPLLRYFHIHSVSPSGWVFVNTRQCIVPEKRTSTCKFEYICKHNSIIPMPTKETIVPYKICSFDIEASSSHGDFPLPIKTYKRLATNIVDVFMRRQNSVQKLTSTTATTLIKKCLLTAFNYDKFENIDVVYPKITPNKKFIQKSVETLLNTPVVEMISNKNAKGLDIETTFETLKENLDSINENVQDDVQENQESSSVPIWSKMKPNKNLLKKADNKLKIVDILLSINYERDEKIKLLNILLQPDDDVDIPMGHALRLFPNLEGDKVTFIGSTFLRYGEKEPYLNNCLVLGGCDSVKGAEIETTETEDELLLKWRDLIQKEDPDVIIGYNIFGFDYEFMFRRA